jgi:hypothetical protein
MPAHGDDAACTEAGVRKPSMKETAMGKHGQCRKLGLCRAQTAVQLRDDGTIEGFNVLRAL